MDNEKIESLRKSLLDINLQIANIEKNHHLEHDIEKKSAAMDLHYLTQKREQIRLKLKREMFKELNSSRGSR